LNPAHLTINLKTTCPCTATETKYLGCGKTLILRFEANSTDYRLILLEKRCKKLSKKEKISSEYNANKI
jgi:hypothetical protein